MTPFNQFKTCKSTNNNNTKQSQFTNINQITLPTTVPPKSHQPVTPIDSPRVCFTVTTALHTQLIWASTSSANAPIDHNHVNPATPLQSSTFSAPPPTQIASTHELCRCYCHHRAAYPINLGTHRSQPRQPSDDASILRHDFSAPLPPTTQTDSTQELCCQP